MCCCDFMNARFLKVGWLHTLVCTPNVCVYLIYLQAYVDARRLIIHSTMLAHVWRMQRLLRNDYRRCRDISTMGGITTLMIPGLSTYQVTASTNSLMSMKSFVVADSANVDSGPWFVRNATAAKKPSGKSVGRANSATPSFSAPRYIATPNESTTCEGWGAAMKSWHTLDRLWVHQVILAPQSCSIRHLVT